MYLIYSPPWIGFSFMSSSCGNSPGSLCNYELSAGLWQWIRSKGWATLTTCRAAHCVLEGWTEHSGCKVYHFTVDLESSYFYGFQERQFWNLPVSTCMRFLTCWRLFPSCCVLSAFHFFSYQDSVPLVDQQLLYTCCPYLGEYFIYICYINKMY